MIANKFLPHFEVDILFLSCVLQNSLVKNAQDLGNWLSFMLAVVGHMQRFLLLKCFHLAAEHCLCDTTGKRGNKSA